MRPIIERAASLAKSNPKEAYTLLEKRASADTLKNVLLDWIHEYIGEIVGTLPRADWHSRTIKEVPQGVQLTLNYLPRASTFTVDAYFGQNNGLDIEILAFGTNFRDRKQFPVTIEVPLEVAARQTVAVLQDTAQKAAKAQPAAPATFDLQD